MVGKQIGLIGLAVMGQNLTLNLAEHGYEMLVYNRTTEVTRDFVEENEAEFGIIGTDSLDQFVSRLDRPRRIVLMVKSGAPVDAVIGQLRPLLETGDVIVDGGNSFWLETERRSEELQEAGVAFLGTGISGGEEGARHGPSIMPGGDGWEGHGRAADRDRGQGGRRAVL